MRRASKPHTATQHPERLTSDLVVQHDRLLGIGLLGQHLHARQSLLDVQLLLLQALAAGQDLVLAHLEQLVSLVELADGGVHVGVAGDEGRRVLDVVRLQGDALGRGRGHGPATLLTALITGSGAGLRSGPRADGSGGCALA